MTDTFVEHHVEFRLPERGRDLVLDDLDPNVVADDRLAFLDRADAADVQPQRGVEFERLATGGRFGVPKHDPDLLAQLINEHHRTIGAIDGAGELPERLTHEPGLEPHVALPHFALDFGLGHQRGNRVDDHDIHRTRAYQDFHDFERLLPGIGL